MVEIEADTIEEAIEKFNNSIDNVALPPKNGYVDGSFTLSTEDKTIISYYN